MEIGFSDEVVFKRNMSIVDSRFVLSGPHRCGRVISEVYNRVLCHKEQWQRIKVADFLK